ncbi:DUF6088 family protein [Chitinophaga eiseniae]|uniref:Transcriptional regulator, AbiEi antitoxin, Type IV TA system n=1 Tax=Chitinophaga eiseniae TaxID=634771 RepID=A0A847SI35_9BACT|nr:DUF6088 family protein [Chitinophaga eiseniae]NLR81491.1 hypothetical protein [Chitinophaga eiseniae]
MLKDIFYIFVPMESIQKKIETKIDQVKKGVLIFPVDFRGLGTATAINMALSRAVRKGKMQRLSHGIYYKPKIDPLFGELMPDPEIVAKVVAKKSRIRIIPTGAQALHLLGLTTQVPVRRIYLTNGEDRQIKIGKTLIEFKHTSPRKLALKGTLSSLVILSLMETGIEALGKNTLIKIKDILLKEKKSILQEDLKLAPARIYGFIVNLMTTDDRMDQPDRRPAKEVSSSGRNKKFLRKESN